MTKNGTHPHDVRKHWPKRGLKWPITYNGVGKKFIDPLPGRGAWRQNIRAAIDTAPGAPQETNAKKGWVDSCFRELVLVVAIHAEFLQEMSMFALFAQFKDQVGWAEKLSVGCITNLFMALLTARGASRVDPSRTAGERDLCKSAVALDSFQERLELIGEAIDIKIFLAKPDNTTVALDNGGIRGFIERGLLYPEYHVIAADITDGLHSLTLSSAPQQEEHEVEIVNALKSVNISQEQEQEDVDMDEGHGSYHGAH